jgi:hypothetical protein
MPAFDLASFDTRTASERGVPMPLLHPRSAAPLTNADGSAVSITLLGRASDTYRDLFRTLQEERITRMSQGIRQTHDDSLNEDTRILVACTKGWNIEALDGAAFPYTAENSQRLWVDTRFLWVRDAAIGFIRNDGNFLPT